MNHSSTKHLGCKLNDSKCNSILSALDEHNTYFHLSFWHFEIIGKRKKEKRFKIFDRMNIQKLTKFPLTQGCQVQNKNKQAILNL